MSEESCFGIRINPSLTGKEKEEAIKKLEKFYLEAYVEAAKEAAKKTIEKMGESIEKDDVDLSDATENKEQYHTEPYIVNEGGVKISLFEFGIDPIGWALGADHVKNQFFRHVQKLLKHPEYERINKARTRMEVKDAFYKYNKKYLYKKCIESDNCEMISVNTLATVNEYGIYAIEQATADEIRSVAFKASTLEGLKKFEKETIKNEKSKRN